MSQEPKPSGALWATILVLGIPLFYCLSFGPACWLVTREKLPLRTMASIYRPLVRAATSRFRPVAAPLCWYADLFAFDNFTPTWGNSSNTVEIMDLMLDE
jgi:hypothetical protein